MELTLKDKIKGALWGVVVGAVAGGLAGLQYGFNNIPTDWVAAIRKPELVSGTIDRFVETLDKKWSGVFETNL